MVVAGSWRRDVTTNDDRYRPIDCDQHSVLELFAMRRKAVVGHAQDETGVPFRLEATVYDVVTRDAAEYLLMRDAAGKTLQVRLDRLLSLHEPDGGLLWRQENVVS